MLRNHIIPATYSEPYIYLITEEEGKGWWSRCSKMFRMRESPERGHLGHLLNRFVLFLFIFNYLKIKNMHTFLIACTLLKVMLKRPSLRSTLPNNHYPLHCPAMTSGYPPHLVCPAQGLARCGAAVLPWLLCLFWTCLLIFWVEFNLKKFFCIWQK